MAAIPAATVVRSDRANRSQGGRGGQEGPDHEDDYAPGGEDEERQDVQVECHTVMGSEFRVFGFGFQLKNSVFRFQFSVKTTFRFSQLNRSEGFRFFGRGASGIDNHLVFRKPNSQYIGTG